MFLHNKIKKEYVVLILGSLILFDMWSIDKRYLNESHFVKESNIRSTDADREILKKNKEGYRVFDLSDNTGGPFNSSRASYFHNSIGGYHAAKLMRYQEIIDYHLSKNNTSVLQMLNCGWVITREGQAVQADQIGLLPPLGDAWLASSVKIVDNANAEIEALNTFDPSRTVIVDKRFESYLKEFTHNNQASIILDRDNYVPNHLIYNLKNIDSEQLVVFSEIYYDKGWNAYVDGTPTPHFRANYVLRGMQIPAGNHVIEFKFEPSIYKIGETVSLTSSVILLLLLAFVSFRELKS